MPSTFVHEVGGVDEGIALEQLDAGLGPSRSPINGKSLLVVGDGVDGITTSCSGPS